MAFFDLNVPYVEHSPTDKANLNAIRTKLVIKAMELGYTGIAHSRTMKGVMSDRDRCSIPLLTVSTILKLAPSLSSSVELHRDLLGVKRDSPFRQYTRLTVTVDSISQAQALNSGNPILKTYDLVAAKPLNQSAFEHACEKSEVDIIAIDFSEKLPFRMKLPVVKTAIKQGVYFEITYSTLIADVQARRQMISSAKLLVDWTGGKNIILSSSAPSANELRGPYDVANLSCLLGLSMERAKAAISGNCRALVAKALRKKQFHKEVIKVELMPPGEQVDPKEPFFGDWVKWDPISSGEGDLLLDDMVKSFSACGKVAKNVKAIDFASVIDSMPSHGFQVKDLISGTQVVCQAPNNDDTFSSAAEVVKVLVATDRESEQSDRPILRSHTNLAPAYDTSSKHETSAYGNSVTIDYESVKSSIDETIETNAKAEPESLNVLNLHTDGIETEIRGLQSQRHVSSCELNLLQPDSETSPRSERDVELDAICLTSAKELSCALKDVSVPASSNEESKNFVSQLGAQDKKMDEGLVEMEMKVQVDMSSVPNDVSLYEKLMGTEQLRKTKEFAISHANGMAVYDSLLHGTFMETEQVRETEDNIGLIPSFESRDVSEGKVDSLVVNHEALEEAIMEEQRCGEVETETNHPTSVQPVSGKKRRKRTKPDKALLFPFNRLLNAIPFKKKSRKFKGRD